MDTNNEPIFPEQNDQQVPENFAMEECEEEPDEIAEIFSLLIESIKNNDIEIVKEILSQHQEAYEFRDEVPFIYLLFYFHLYLQKKIQIFQYPIFHSFINKVSFFSLLLI